MKWILAFILSISFSLHANSQGLLSKLDSLNYYFDVGVVVLEDVGPVVGFRVEDPKSNISLSIQRSYIPYVPTVDGRIYTTAFKDISLFYNTDVSLSYKWNRHSRKEGKELKPLILSLGHHWYGQDGSDSYVEKGLKASVAIPIRKLSFELGMYSYYTFWFEPAPLAKVSYALNL